MYRPVGLSRYPIVVEIPLAWGEQDAFQHINNVHYFRYFESARIAYFEEIAPGGAIGADGVGPILAATSCRYRAPLTYPDKILVGARVTRMGEDRFDMDYAIYSPALRVIAAVGDGLVVAFDYKKAGKAPLPEEWRRRILELEGGAVPPMPPRTAGAPREEGSP